MRGKQIASRCRDAGGRITPAHAGKTRFKNRHEMDWADHPRTCGENHDGREITINNFGSPPHMRGKRPYAWHFIPPHRITPAHAGKTSSLDMRQHISADHPRTCGENNFGKNMAAFTAGSPPHMRGKLLARPV